MNVRIRLVKMEQCVRIQKAVTLVRVNLDLLENIVPKVCDCDLFCIFWIIKLVIRYLQSNHILLYKIEQVFFLLINGNNEAVIQTNIEF